jgi:hypothetical protein
MPVPNFKPPLTAEQLRDIQARRDPADIIPLLWEIKRLRALVLRADQLQGGLGSGGIILETLRDELVGEPCVEESQGQSPRPWK